MTMLRRVVIPIATASMAFAGIAVTASPAQAYALCTDTQEREFPTSGYNTDLYVRTCVLDGNDSGGRYRYAVVSGYWQDGGGVRKFDNFDVVARLEHFDEVFRTKTCDLTSEINGRSADSFQCQTGKFYDNEYVGQWTGDGHINFDLDADGQGGSTWQLLGSPKGN
jgi:hypothetical protein